MSRIVFALIIGLSFTGVASAQDDPPPPCGPAGQLPSELSGNVAADSRCFELRIYTAEPARNGQGGIDNLGLSGFPNAILGPFGVFRE